MTDHDHIGSIRARVLFCIRIADDVHAMPSLAIAQIHAEHLNREAVKLAAPAKPAHRVQAATWPHSADAHADYLKNNFMEIPA